MLKRKSTKALIVSLIIIASGLSVLCYMFNHGILEININPEYIEGQIKVACVGDSVTHGHGIYPWKDNNYPALLGDMMGEEYHVSNFGVSGSTVQDSGDQPYTKTKDYPKSLDYEADILVFMMGSNDSKPENWQGEEKFIEAYNKLLDTYLQGDKVPDVYLCTPPTAFFPDGVTEGFTNYDIQPLYVETVADIVREIAKERNLPLIEINNLTENRRDLFGKDNVHPNNDGAKAIAQEVFENIR